MFKNDYLSLTCFDIFINSDLIHHMIISFWILLNVWRHRVIQISYRQYCKLLWLSVNIHYTVISLTLSVSSLFYLSLLLFTFLSLPSSLSTLVLIISILKNQSSASPLFSLFSCLFLLIRRGWLNVCSPLRPSLSVSTCLLKLLSSLKQRSLMER